MAIARFGMGGACDIDANGEVMYNGMPISASLVRECDGITGAQHWEYAMPEDTGNININVADQFGNIIGYRNEDGQFVANPAGNPQQSVVHTQVSSAAPASGLLANLLNQAVINTANAQAIAAAASAAGTLHTPTSNAGSVVNTPQTVTNVQGNLNNVTPTNTNAGGGNTGSPSLNFNDLISSGSGWIDSGVSWLGGKTLGINNSFLAIGGAIALAVGSGYIGGRRRR